MFTSRAEYRILLRQDNADLRLTPKFHEIGLAGTDRYEKVKEKLALTKKIAHFIDEYSVDPLLINDYLAKVGSASLSQKVKLSTIVPRPNVNIREIIMQLPDFQNFISGLGGDNVPDAVEQVEIHLKYSGYIDRERENAEKIGRLEDFRLKDDINYHQIPSLSSEARQKLSNIKPATLGQASRISGVSPADISVLMVYLGR